jgi:hypothetical protein
MTGAAFDTSWIMMISRAEHQWSVDNIWEGDPSKDPWSRSGGRLWPAWIDRDAIAAVNTETHVAALYGPVIDTDKSVVKKSFAMEVSAVLMDLRMSEYRNWSVKRLIANLGVMGIDPGEQAVVKLAYKPGWHVHYSGPPSRDRCAIEGSRMWLGPASPCGGLNPPGGPFARTPYGAGEFEEALNAMIQEIRAGLVANGLEKVLIMTVERPPFQGSKWSILKPELRRAHWLIGDLSATCDRRDLSLPPNPISCRRRGESGAQD